MLSVLSMAAVTLHEYLLAGCSTSSAAAHREIEIKQNKAKLCGKKANSSKYLRKAKTLPPMRHQSVRQQIYPNDGNE